MNSESIVPLFPEYDFDAVEEYNPLKGIHPELEIASPDVECLVAANDEFLEDEIDLTIPQWDFLTLDVKFPLFVAGYGSGKSKTLAVCAVRDLVNYPGANIGIYAPTYDLLGLIIQPYIAEILDAGGYVFTYNQQKHYFEVQGYGKIICRSLDNPSRIVGYETFRAHADEIDTINQDKAQLAWDRMLGRNRQKVYVLDDNGRRIQELDEDGNLLFDESDLPIWKVHQNRVSAYTTPEGWKFAYNQWIEKGADNPDYGYITASTRSNAHNLPPDYIPSLIRSYPPELIDAYIDGKFTNLTQGRVYKNFDRTLNNSNEIALPDDTLHIGMDFNIEHCSALVVIQRKDKETGKVTDHAVDEFTDLYDTDELISAIIERYPKNKKIVYPDASGTKRSTGAGGVNTRGEATTTDLFKLKRHFLVMVDRSNPAIKDRVVNAHSRICNGIEERRFLINSQKCPNMVKTLEQQVWNEGVPDKSQGLDHLGDCFGYVMFKLHPPIRRVSGFIPA